VLVYDAPVARLVDALSILLLVAACAVFLHGFKALADREDLRALYDGLVGALALKAAVDLLRPRTA
jgi:hypothetical protein